MNDDNRTFSIPNDKDELQVFNENQYYVTEVIGIDQIKDQYTSCRTDFETEGANFIYEKFDLMYSSLVHFPNLSWKIIYELWDVALDGLKCQVKTLTPLLETIDDLDEHVRAQILRNTKMLFYTLSELMVCCEERQLQDNAVSVPQKGRRKAPVSDTWNWTNQKNVALSVLYSLVKLPLNKLWNPANISEDFLDQMSRCCLKLLEDREIGFVSKKPVRDSIFQILSVLCKEYIFGLSLMPRMIQMLMLYEHLAVPLAQSVVQLENQEGNIGMLRLALQELNSDMDFLNKSGHNCGQFVLELGKSNPLRVSKYLELVTPHLDRDPYGMRIGVIELLGLLILHVYKDSKITEVQIEEKILIFDYLLEHLYDVIAFCRSRTLQVWKQLCEEDVIPTNLLLTVVEKVQPCIIDKTSNTRKDAIKFMKSVLEHNPFASRLDTESIKQQLTQTKDHLTKMERKAGISEEEDPEYFWKIHSEEVAKAVHEVLTEEAQRKKAGQPSLAATLMQEYMDQDENADVNASMVQVLFRVANLIRTTKFREAVITGISLVKKYDTQNVLGVAKSQATQASQNPQESSGDESEEDEDEELSEEERRFQKKVRIMQQLMHMACQAQQQNMQQNALEISDEMQAALTKQRELVTFLQDSLKFSVLVHGTVDRVFQVLESSQTTELSEAIDFISVAQQFGLISEQQGMTRLLSFVHSKDMNLKNAITSAYKRVYLQAMHPDEGEITHENVIEAMKKVCQLVQKSPALYERSLKELVQEWVASRDINRECIDVLWEMVTGTKKDECLAAMNLLHMVLDGNSQNVQDHLHYLEKFGFGHRGEECFELVRNACKVLALASPPVASDQESAPYKINEQHPIFNCLSKIIVEGLCKTQDKDYCDMVSHAMSAIFKTCDRPSVLVDSIIKNMIIELNDPPSVDSCDKTLTPTKNASQILNGTTGHTTPSARSDQAQSQKEDAPISQVMLTRFMSVLGSVARQLLVFLMEEVLLELRRQRNLSDKKRPDHNNYANEEGGEEGYESDTSVSSVRSNLRLQSLTEEEALDKVQNTCNNELLNNNNILGQFLPLIEDVCQHPAIYTNPSLQVAAVHTLGRCMMLSRNYCSSKLRLLSTMMVKSQDPRVRIAAIHTMADLLRRFPNETDPYSPNLYQCLKDTEVEVRREGLVVLSKLILGDMLRVKFQISYLAACLTDSDQCCQDIASFFFATLATKGNILYNVVLDMISQLGSDKSQEEFESIMKVILPYIDKERQVVALVEKLCTRFPEKTTEKESHDLAVCIKNLPVSFKLIKALREGFTFYADKLKYITVKISFDSILQTARKQLKGQDKDFVEDFQESLDKCCDKKAVMEAVAEQAANATKEKAAAKASKNKKTNLRRRRQDSSEEDKVKDEDSAETSSTTSRRSTRIASRISSRLSSDSDNVFEEQTPSRQARSKRTASTRSQRKQTVEKSSTTSTRRLRTNLRL